MNKTITVRVSTLRVSALLHCFSIRQCQAFHKRSGYPPARPPANVSWTGWHTVINEADWLTSIRRMYHTHNKV